MRTFVGPLLIAGAAAAALGGCQPKAVAPVRTQARVVSVVAVAPHEIQGGVVASGPLVPREELDIFPQLTTYRALQVLVDEGSWVKAGQPLARLDDTLLRAQLAQQDALARQQKILADRADQEAARVKGLDKEGILSQEQIDQRRFAAESARAQASAQTAAAEDVRTREALMVVRAPSAGLVYERNVRIGDVGGSTPWFRIARDGQVELAADVSEDAVEKIKVGAPVKVTLADQTQVNGVVRLVSPGVDAQTRLGRVRVALPVRPDIRAGGFARGAFLGVSHSSSAVPETAVRYDANGASVLVVGQGGRVVAVPVVTGQHGDGFVELLKGPPDGAMVVKSAATMLTPGDIVEAAPAA
ncbi:MAG TPA: efflux RND transporter periplasmic adaptor subunit [Caulobacteraceae bacterium]|jgi:HlyD family secretion protein|nr:efflux RND transporter periplasmic adaptor subunit [Caulobacteraceae bacterium]